MTKLILMAGPCVVEGLDKIKIIAKDLKTIANNPKIDFYFKASFDKANRTSLENFRGIGIKEGLKVLNEIKKEFGYKIITDIHECYQVELAAEVADILQIPALLCRQTDLIVESSKTDKIINIKKGQFMNPIDMQYAILKAIKTRGGENADYETSKRLNVWLTERGSSFGYGNLVVDMRSLIIMRKFAPVIFDATHSVQMPGMGGGKSSGDSSFAPILARAAAAVGVDGYFIETHNDPKNALSDGSNMIASKDIDSLLDTLIKIKELV
ncbi:3-deoxy-8-phosphooctulonate synthase [Helicobacter sp. MIT 14-3879]|uniref:3-deoxy-8-phosphooctulonate synthase n=1 Tax=Helicobacter sp. MIT 14-3879 TaxID=2040649 RepID=UPI000E1F423E|nr:3-deoxy-8-phosphooctulonate synthase [Helicobacter sp. MIT 14-3879]RDU62890.1 3-deoxy-8-phosphooctulonate synthase [Helicobacter sp. MIT 14-3879]